MTAARSLQVPDLKSTLDSVVQQTFEGLYFLEASPLPDSEMDKISGAEGLSVQIAIKGNLVRQIEMCLTHESARRIVAVHIAKDQDSNDLIADAFSEILNTIGGRFAAALASSSSSFELSIPKVSFNKIGASKTHDILACYQVEFGCIYFVCHFFHL